MSLSDQFLDAAAGDLSWDEVGVELGEHLGSEPVDILVRDATTGRLVLDATGSSIFGTTSLSESALRAYVERFEASDTLRRRAWALGPGRAWCTPMLIDPAQWHRGECFNEWHRPNDATYVLGAAGALRGSRAMHFSGRRGGAAGPFGPDDVERIQRLLAPLVRAADLGLRLAEAHGARDVAWEALDALSDAVFAIDDAGRLLHANEAGEALRRLGAAQTHAPGRGPPSQRKPSRTRAQERTLLWVFRPVPPRLGRTGAVALAFVTDEAPRAPSTAWLREVFGLTPAEARLVRSVVAGLSVAAAATNFGVAEATCRNQLKAAFRKTDTGRQAELVAKILRAAPRIDVVEES